MVKLRLLLVVAAVGSLCSCIVHVVTVEWLPQWIGTQMRGIQMQSSWDVRYVAAITSIEYGIAALAIYMLCRKRIRKYGILKCVGLFAVLLAALHGAFVRQPLMDYLVGNPLQVVAVQNGFQWLVWILMSVVVVTGVEIVHKRYATRNL